MSELLIAVLAGIILYVFTKKAEKVEKIVEEPVIDKKISINEPTGIIEPIRDIAVQEIYIHHPIQKPIEIPVIENVGGVTIPTESGNILISKPDLKPYIESPVAHILPISPHDPRLQKLPVESGIISSQPISLKEYLDKI